ncbi:hypothetical protein Leryth_004754 [Lithospermum erythrorhizon]|nr:hypothetical protein Leryth_004754 [Lithospermum erythrorhizon]
METGDVISKVDDDGRPKRTGTTVTASAHIITAVIGSGVLSLAWATAQLGWIAGPLCLVLFSIITWFNSLLLADCYRSPTGARNPTYMDVVKANLGGAKYHFCGLAQYSNFVGTTIGYTITASISMVAIKRSNCFNTKGHDSGCHISNNPFMIIYGVIQIILSQIPNFNKIAMLSIVASLMSFIYSSIGLGLSLEKIIEGRGEHIAKGLTGKSVGNDFTRMDKMWNSFSAVGDIAFAYAFSLVLIEIQDTLKSGPPENEVMKRASTIGISVSTMFYLLCGITGYAAFGDDSPGNLLTGFGFYEPFWLVDIANLCIAIHLIGAYQVFSQPLYKFVEDCCRKKWPNSKFINGEKSINLPWGGIFSFSLLRLVWRTSYVIMTTIISMMFPIFNDICGFLGALGFWPLTVYFPIEMHLVQAKVPRYSLHWICMRILSLFCLCISLLAAAGSLRGIVEATQTFKFMRSVS